MGQVIPQSSDRPPVLSHNHSRGVVDQVVTDDREGFSTKPSTTPPHPLPTPALLHQTDHRSDNSSQDTSPAPAVTLEVQDHPSRIKDTQWREVVPRLSATGSDQVGSCPILWRHSGLNVLFGHLIPIGRTNWPREQTDPSDCSLRSLRARANP